MISENCVFCGEPWKVHYTDCNPLARERFQAGLRFAEFTKDSDNALKYAQHLAMVMWEKHWKADAPDWRPLPDLLGVLTQIDNMVAAMDRRKPVPFEGPK